MVAITNPARWGYTVVDMFFGQARPRRNQTVAVKGDILQDAKGKLWEFMGREHGKIITKPAMTALATKAASTGAECHFWLATDDNWYMGLSDEPPDDDAERDYWEPEFDYYGPFPSLEDARAYLHRNFANPGGSSADRSGRKKPPASPIRPTNRSRGFYFPTGREVTAFNKENPADLLAQLVKVLEKAGLDEVVATVRDVSRDVSRAWQQRVQ
jgi:hypothetical protein